MEELVWKEAPLTLRLRKRFLYIKYYKTFYFEIKQANFWELTKFDYRFRRPELTMYYIFELLNKHNKKFKRKHYHQLQLDDYEKILDFFLLNYCKKFYNLDWLKEKPKEGETKESKINRPFSSVIAFVLKNTNETSESLKKLTWEEIEYINEGIVWNMNDETKEGKLKNQKKSVQGDLQKWKYENDLKAVRKQRKNVLGLLQTKTK